MHNLNIWKNILQCFGECEMTDQKLENILNLALDASEEERDKSLELNVGYDPILREWDLIVKYTGTLDCVRALGAQVVELQSGYGIITIHEDRIPELTNCVEIEYVEKPKRLFFQVENGKRVSCITSVQSGENGLSGRGVLVAIIDSGIDFENRVFRNPDGTTRIKNLWDQTVTDNPPEGYLIGTEYTEEEINQALRGEMQIRSRDVSGHGTSVAGILAGNSEDYQGVAHESELLVVKLGIPQADGFPRTTELMQAIDYVIRKAIEFRQPVAVNISFGNTYGSHEPYN